MLDELVHDHDLQVNEGPIIEVDHRAVVENVSHGVPRPVRVAGALGLADATGHKLAGTPHPGKGLTSTFRSYRLDFGAMN